MSPLALIYPKKQRANTAIHRLVKKIMGDDEAVFRGFYLGQNFDQVLAQEKFKIFESEPLHTGVSYTTRNMEMVDILYFKNGFNLLEKIQVEVFMNSDEDSDLMFEAMYFYLFKKHGFPVPMTDLYLWTHDDDFKISLKKLSNNGDKGVSLLYEK